MTDYEETMEADKRICACGTGYVVRVTREVALMGLNPGDIVHITLKKVKE